MNHVLIYDYTVLHGDGLETKAQAASHEWCPDTSELTLSRADEECGGFVNVNGWTRELIGAGLNDPPPDTTSVPGFNPGDNVRVNEAVPSPLLPRVGDLVRWRSGGRIMTLAHVSGGDTRCEWEDDGQAVETFAAISDLVPAGAIDENGEPITPHEPMIRRGPDD